MDQEKEYIYTMEFYSAVKKNDTMWFKSKQMQLEDMIFSEVSRFKEIKTTCFLSYVEDRSKR
jgi:hypothetical protein